MDQALIKRYATELEDVLRQYAATEQEAAELLMALVALISDAKAGKIPAPVRWGDLPGEWYFF